MGRFSAHQYGSPIQYAMYTTVNVSRITPTTKTWNEWVNQSIRNEQDEASRTYWTEQVRIVLDEP